jgi:hypothetical protein
MLRNVWLVFRRRAMRFKRLNATVDFELFRPELEKSALRADGTKGSRPAFDHVLMFKVLVLQAMNGISDEQAEYFLRDRLTWKRFLGLGLYHWPVPLTRGGDSQTRCSVILYPVRAGRVCYVEFASFA